MHALGRIFGGLFDGLLFVFGWLGPAMSLAAISLLLGVLMLLAFKWLGDEDALTVSRKRMAAHLMEMRLFDRNPWLVFRSMGRLMAWNGRFFVASLRPAIIATAPMILLFVQMERYYGVRPLDPGEAAVVTARVDAALADAVGLEASGDAVEVETRGVRARDGTVSWRVRGKAEGAAQLVLTGLDQEVAKSIHVGTHPTPISVRRGRSTQDQLLHPAEPPIEAAGVRWIELSYPTTTISMFGLDAHWLVWLVLISVIGVFPIRALVNRVRPDTL